MSPTRLKLTVYVCPDCGQIDPHERSLELDLTYTHQTILKDCGKPVRVVEVVPKADLDYAIEALWECMKNAGADTSYADGAQHAYHLRSLEQSAVQAVAELRRDYIEAGGG